MATLGGINIVVSEAPGAGGSFSAAHELPKGRGMVAIRGTFEATVTLQVREAGGSGWEVLKTYDAPAFENLEFLARVELRIGVDEGDYTSGTATCHILAG